MKVCCLEQGAAAVGGCGASGVGCGTRVKEDMVHTAADLGAQELGMAVTHQRKLLPERVWDFESGSFRCCSCLPFPDRAFIWLGWGLSGGPSSTFWGG